MGYVNNTVAKNIPGWGTINYGGPRKGAKLTIDSIPSGGTPQATLTGNTTAQNATISTGPDGKATGTIISSNLIDDSATIVATVGSSSQPVSISFGSPSVVVELPAYLTGSFDVKTKVTFNSQDVDNHAVKVRVSRVEIPWRLGWWKSVNPKSKWKDYVKHMELDATTDGTGVAVTPTGLLVSARVTYSSCDMTAFRDSSSAWSMMMSFIPGWLAPSR